MKDSPKNRENERIRVPLTVTQITVGNINGNDRVLGLGADSRVYYYTAHGWRPLAPGLK